MGTLNRDALQGYERKELALEPRYAPRAIDRVRELVSKEAKCCAFLRFDLYEIRDEVTLTITTPRGREGSRHHALSAVCRIRLIPLVFPMTIGYKNLLRPQKAACSAALLTAAGVVACGVCCILPIALSAIALAEPEVSLAGLLVLSSG